MNKYRKHKAVYRILRVIVAPFFKHIYRYECEVQSGPAAPFIVLANHNLNVDPVLLGLSFKQHMYYVASEHIYRWGLASKLMVGIFAPIARLKGSTDARTALEIIRKVQDGQNVGIFAEGNRSYNGVTGPISASTGKLIKAAKATLVTFRFEGGYFTEPRWCLKRRRGRMRGSIVHTYTPEMLEAMSAEEVQAAIERDLHEDAYERQRQQNIAYKGKQLAEALEIALFICPRCEQIGKLRSNGDMLFCECGMQARYTVYGELVGEGLPFCTITHWDEWQQRILLDRVERGQLALSDEGQQLRRVNAGKGSVVAGAGRLTMEEKFLRCGEFCLPMEEISDMAIVSRMTLAFTTKSGEAYEVISDMPRSATKYMTYYQCVKRKG